MDKIKWLKIVFVSQIFHYVIKRYNVYRSSIEIGVKAKK